MPPLPFGLDLTGLLVLGSGAALLGLALLLGKPSSSWRLALGLTALLAAGLATWLPFLDVFAALRGPLLALAGAGAACLLLSSAYPRRLVAAAFGLLARPRVQGAALLAAGLLLFVVVPWQLERAAAQLGDAKASFPDDSVAAQRHQKKYTLSTDRGNPLDVFDLGGHVDLVDERTAEAQLVESHDLEMRLIRTAPPDAGSNCHGWVFTGGRYLVDGGDVDRILLENGYQAVTEPRVGDLVIYRLRSAVAAHSAVVRVATDDGLILLESKWNTLGCYLHRPEDYVAGATWTYYRSPRHGHLLRGIDPVESQAGRL